MKKMKKMTPFELGVTILRFTSTALYARAYADLIRLTRQKEPIPVLLDVGGRKSPYTVGVNADVVIMDVPRETELQRTLNLGIGQSQIEALRRRRSNVQRLILEDMTHTLLDSASFDGVIAVEVLEHVRDDEAFVRQCSRVLKPGGWFYMTTPNGDYVRNEPPNHNPAHLRHYTREDLSRLLRRYFEEVSVVYAVKTGKWRRRGLRSLSLRHPARSLSACVSNIINRWESRGLDEQLRRTAHLVAVCRKAAGG